MGHFNKCEPKRWALPIMKKLGPGRLSIQRPWDARREPYEYGWGSRWWAEESWRSSWEQLRSYLVLNPRSEKDPPRHWEGVVCKRWRRQSGREWRAWWLYTPSSSPTPFSIILRLPAVSLSNRGSIDQQLVGLSLISKLEISSETLTT